MPVTDLCPPTFITQAHYRSDIVFWARLMQSRRSSSTSEPERVLSTWQMLEQFNPQQLPALTMRAASSTKQVIDWRPGDELPWNALPEQEIARGPKDGPLTVPICSTSQSAARNDGSMSSETNACGRE